MEVSEDIYRITMENNQALISPVAVIAFSALSACGQGNKALYQALSKNQSALAPLELLDVPFKTYVGAITQPLHSLDPDLIDFDSRNSRVALTALNDIDAGVRVAMEEVKSKYGSQRVGVVIGTSTSGLNETEDAYMELLKTDKLPADFHFVKQHAYQATARFLQRELGLSGVCYAVSTACSSGAKAIAAGQRLIASGVCDAVLVGGVDTLCRLTLRGFHSLDLVAESPCTPMDKNRQGLSIGEAAGLLVLEKCCSSNLSNMKILAVGESADAYHMSTPHPEGIGAVLAMNNSLKKAGVSFDMLDYLNLHATATKINDRVESAAVYSIFANNLKCSGTKGLTGHTLGASGALETIITLLALQYQFIPGTYGLEELEGDCKLQVVKTPLYEQKLQIAMSNSFGFGGNNASVLVGL